MAMFPLLAKTHNAVLINLPFHYIYIYIERERARMIYLYLRPLSRYRYIHEHNMDAVLYSVWGVWGGHRTCIRPWHGKDLASSGTG